jgi:hypothetical protein
MDLATANAVIATAGAAINLFDKAATQVVRFIRKDPSSEIPKQFSYNVGGKKDKLEVTHQGRRIQVITGKDLESLPKEYYGHIQTYESSLRRKYDVWKEVFPLRDSSVDPVANAKINAQLRDLSLKMKDDLIGIIDFLASIHVELDDHYMVYRDVIERYHGEEDDS